jgi:hypothetical protein
MRGWLRCDHRRGFAAYGKVSATCDGVLKDALPENGLGSRGRAFGETGVDGGFGAGVGEEQVLDDLLDAPFVGACAWLELGLCGVESAEGGCDLALEMVEGGVHLGGFHPGRITLHRLAGVTPLPVTELLVVAELLEFGQGLFGVFGLFAVGVELEIGLVLGNGFVLFLHLLRDLGEGEVGGGVIGLDADRIFGAEVGALIVFVAQIKLCDAEIFVYALVVSLNPLDLGEFAMNGGAFRRIRRIAFGGGGVWCGVGVIAAGAGTAARIIAGKFGRGLGGEWMLRGGIRRLGCRTR